MTSPVAIGRADDELWPAPAELDAICVRRYGPLDAQGWGPRLRRRFGHYAPDDWYEATVDHLVTPGCAWLDVGCGRFLFPSNPSLAEALAARCGRLVGVDPDDTVRENRFVHEAVQSTIDAFTTERPVDLVTLRMVAEHVEEPDRVAAAIAGATRPGGLVVVYTVNRFSPVPLLTGLVPFGLRHGVKRFLWGTEEKDTFPTCFRMNTRRRLRSVFAAAGFREVGFRKLDDCRTLGRFRVLHAAELTVARVCRGIGLHYPENCLLGIYRRQDA